MKKKFSVAVIVLFMLVVLVTGCGRPAEPPNGPRFASIKDTKTTSLAEENINGLRLFQSINDNEFISKYGKDLTKQNNQLYDYYELKDGLVIATNKEGKIIRIAINSGKNSALKTNKGISPGSSIDDIIKYYGANNYRRNEQGASIIGYIDRNLNVTLEFWGNDKQVQAVRLDIASMN